MQLSSGWGRLLRYGMSSVSLLQLCIMFNPRTVPLVPGAVATGSYARPGSGWMCVCVRDDTPIHPRTRACSPPACGVVQEGLRVCRFCKVERLLTAQACGFGALPSSTP